MSDLARSPLWGRAPMGYGHDLIWTGTDAELEAELDRWRGEHRRRAALFDNQLATAMRNGGDSGPVYESKEGRAVGAAAAFVETIERLQQQRRKNAEERAMRDGFVAGVLGPDAAVTTR